MSTTGWFKLRRRVVGLVFLVILALLLWLSVALFDQRFTPVTLVTLETSSAGNEMHEHAAVKLRGVEVGEVRQISADGTGARLLLALRPDQVRWLPVNVSAQLLPTTLFGERYVDLIVPANPDPRRLVAGSVIGEDHSADAIELQRVLGNLMNLLQAVQPDKLSVTLTAVSQALQGRGTELGQTIVSINTYLQQVNPELPALDKDISELVSVADGFNRAAPDVVQALADFATTSRTLVDQRANLNNLYTTLTSASGNLDTFLRRNSPNLIQLVTDAGPTLRSLARYAPEYPCLLRQLTAFEAQMDKVLGKGTNQPGLHVNITVVPPSGAYRPGADTPRYTDDSGPHCYASTAASVSQPNSGPENELVNELTAAGTAVPPTALPGWTSLLAGPLYRGTEVNLK